MPIILGMYQTTIWAAEFSHEFTSRDLRTIYADRGTYEVYHQRDGTPLAYCSSGERVGHMPDDEPETVRKIKLECLSGGGLLFVSRSPCPVEFYAYDDQTKSMRAYSPEELAKHGWTALREHSSSDVSSAGRAVCPDWLDPDHIDVVEYQPIYCTKCDASVIDDYPYCRHLFRIEGVWVEERCGIASEVVGAGREWVNSDVSLDDCEWMFKQAVSEGASRIAREDDENMTVASVATTILRIMEHAKRFNGEYLSETIYLDGESVRYPLEMSTWEIEGFAADWLHTIESWDHVTHALTRSWLMDLLRDDAGQSVTDLVSHLTRADRAQHRLRVLSREHTRLRDSIEPMHQALAELRRRHTHVWVAAYLRRDDGRILLRRRAAGTVDAGLYGPPGGLVEPGESLRDALSRELYEEIGLVHVRSEFLHVAHCYEQETSGVVFLYRVTQWTGDTDCPRDEPGHESWEWVDPRSLKAGDVQSGIGLWLGLDGTGDVIASG